MAKTSATSTAPNDAPASSPAAGGDGWTQRILTLNPKRRGIFIWTDALRKNVPEIASCKAGVLNLFLRSTTAALSVNENADPDVRTDLENALDRVVPGTDVLDATSRSAFVGVSLDVPVQGGKLALGTWQGLYLCEWGDGAEPCQVVATLVDASDDVRCTRNVTIRAPRRGCHLVQDEVDDAFKPTRNRLKPGAKPGLANLLIRHTSASLTMNENADPTVRGDLEAALNRIVPEEWHHTLFEHVEEGPDDMTAHVKSTLLGCSLTVPVDATGRMNTGTWQGVYLCEHRNVGGMGVGHAREVATTLIDGAGVANTAGQTTVTLTAPGGSPLRIEKSTSMRPTDVPDSGLLCDLLWSDPERNEPGWGENDRGCSYTFGPKIVDQFCTDHGFDLVCRAHQVMDGGYEFFCKRKLATVFSASNYCGDQGNRGSILNVDKRLKCSLVILLPNDDQETHELLAGTTSASSSVGAGQAMQDEICDELGSIFDAAGTSEVAMDRVPSPPPTHRAPSPRPGVRVME